MNEKLDAKALEAAKAAMRQARSHTRAPFGISDGKLGEAAITAYLSAQEASPPAGETSDLADKAVAWDAIAEKNAEIAKLRARAETAERQLAEAVAALEKIETLLATAFGAGVYDIGPPAPGMEGTRSHSQNGYAQAVFDTARSIRARLAGDAPAASPPSPAVKPVAWHWWARTRSAIWPVWVWQTERPKHAPPDAIPLYASPVREDEGRDAVLQAWHLCADGVPAAVTLIVSRFDDEAGEWIVGVAESYMIGKEPPPVPKWTHWRHVGPMPDAIRALSTATEEKA